MNPFRWTPEHQIAWLVTSILGAITGLFVGFIVALNLQHEVTVQYAGTFFDVWIQQPERCWPWPVFGAVIAALAAYAIRLWKTSN